MGNQIKHLSRTERLAIQQQKLQNEQVLIQALAIKKGVKKSFEALIEKIFSQTICKESLPDETAILIFELFRKTVKKEKSKQYAFKQLLLHLEKLNCYRLLAEEKFLTALYHIALFNPYFIREIQTWKRESHNPEKQFSSLIRYCFAQYPVPLFMDTAWFASGKDVERQWFIDIASGYSVRKLSFLPVQLTKRMAHEFMLAPSYCNIAEAFRYAQVKAFGGDDYLAYYINRSRIGRNEFKDEAFWVTVIQFFAALPMFDVSHLDTMTDYMAEQRRLSPHFSMKGRTADALLRQTLAWHDQLNRQRNRGGVYVWRTSGIGEFMMEEGKEEQVKIYKITELLSSNELSKEGKIMHHCVSSYASSCHQGKCAIFSLTMENVRFFEPQHLVTIEVDLKNHKVVQAKGKFNARPLVKEMEIIKKWADTVSIGLSKWL